MVFDDSESWDDHTIVTWDYEGGDVIYLSNKEKKRISQEGTYLLTFCCIKESSFQFSYFHKKNLFITILSFHP
jgi:hypothetical protein